MWWEDPQCPPLELLLYVSCCHDVNVSDAFTPKNLKTMEAPPHATPLGFVHSFAIFCSFEVPPSK